MVPSSEELSYIFQRRFGQILAQIHDDLPREDDLGILFLGNDVRRTDAEVLGNDFQNAGKRDFVRRVRRPG